MIVKHEFAHSLLAGSWDTNVILSRRPASIPGGMLEVAYVNCAPNGVREYADPVADPVGV
ncbi:hypothetical protein GF337_10285 [candidate division KSB1 bacterium]|nr:hypothetical protein [candidate division KSB1 bacterium]